MMEAEREIFGALGAFLLATTQDVHREAGDDDLALTVGVSTMALIACAVRNPRWSQWFVAYDEDAHREQGTDPRDLDANIMEYIPVGAQE